MFNRKRAVYRGMFLHRLRTLYIEV